MIVFVVRISYLLSGTLILSVIIFSLEAYADSSQQHSKTQSDFVSSLLHLISFSSGDATGIMQCKNEIKEIPASLGVWGYLNKFYQSKIHPSSASDSFSKKSPAINLSKDSSSSKNEGAIEIQPSLEHASSSGIPCKQSVSNHQTPSDSLIQKNDYPLGKIVAHKAQYSITLEKNFGDDISDAVGEMTIRVFDTGDGYVFEQNSSLIIYNTDGEGEQIITNLASWQDYQGNRYRFNARTLRNGEQEDVIKGEALKDPLTQTAYVTYQLPNPVKISIPYDAIFPFHHLLNAINMAKHGGSDKGVLTNIVFDGSSETYEAVSVDTLLGDLTASHLTLKTGDLEIDNSVKQQWPMRLSVYPIGSRTLDPDYSMDQNVLSCGIIKDMTLDYGTFQLKATLETDKVMLYDEKAPKF